MFSMLRSVMPFDMLFQLLLLCCGRTLNSIRKVLIKSFLLSFFITIDFISVTIRTCSKQTSNEHKYVYKKNLI